MKGNTEKIKKKYRTFRKYENKVAQPFFYLFLILAVIIVLFANLPAASDKTFFIYFVMFVLVVISCVVGVFVKRNKDRKGKFNE